MSAPNNSTFFDCDPASRGSSSHPFSPQRGSPMVRGAGKGRKDRLKNKRGQAKSTLFPGREASFDLSSGGKKPNYKEETGKTAAALSRR